MYCTILCCTILYSAAPQLTLEVRDPLVWSESRGIRVHLNSDTDSFD